MVHERARSASRFCMSLGKTAMDTSKRASGGYPSTRCNAPAGPSRPSSRHRVRPQAWLHAHSSRCCRRQTPTLQPTSTPPSSYARTRKGTGSAAHASFACPSKDERAMARPAHLRCLDMFRNHRLGATPDGWMICS
eukprot:scaffold261962_cov32-Tisochrysis_lutea.AAC.3